MLSSFLSGAGSDKGQSIGSGSNSGSGSNWFAMSAGDEEEMQLARDYRSRKTSNVPGLGTASIRSRGGTLRHATSFGNGLSSSSSSSSHPLSNQGKGQQIQAQARSQSQTLPVRVRRQSGSDSGMAKGNSRPDVRNVFLP